MTVDSKFLKRWNKLEEFGKEYLHASGERSRMARRGRQTGIKSLNCAYETLIQAKTLQTIRVESPLFKYKILLFHNGNQQKVEDGRQ